MDHKLATIMGAAALISLPAASEAGVSQQGPAVPVASSHAELLEPIGNAVERLKVSDAEYAARDARLQTVQYNAPVDHHHHHHHHHHSHDWYVQNGYRLLGGRWVTGEYYAHHHHHHHHHHHQQDYDR